MSTSSHSSRINAAVIVLRFREPDAPRPFRIPGSVRRVPVVPVLGIVGAVVMMTWTGLLAALIAAGVVLLGLVVRTLVLRFS
jgi:APA family basic amino acid/polyamine antiporter